MSDLKKEAQQRRKLDRLRQWMNLGDRAHSLWDTDFKKFRNKLIDSDKKAREEAMALKDIKLEAEAGFKQKNYLYSAVKVGEYYDHLVRISNILQGLFSSFTNKENELLVDHLDPTIKQEILRRMKQAGQQDAMVKTAFFDWLKKLVLTRRRAMENLEKNFAAQNLQNLRDGLGLMLKNINTLHDQLIDIFKELSSSLARGDYNHYRDELGKLFILSTKHKKDYDVFFKKAVEPYHTYIQKQFDEEEKRQQHENEVTRQYNEAVEKKKNPTVAPASVQVPAAPRGEPVVVRQPTQYQDPSHQARVEMTPPRPPMESIRPNSDLERRLPTGDMEGFAPQSDSSVSSRRFAPTEPAPNKTPELSEPDVEIPRISLREPTSPGRQPAPSKGPVTRPMMPSRGPATRPMIEANHSAFLTSLAAVIDDSEMINKVLAYSESIEDSDPETSLKLLAIVEGLVSE